MFCRHCGTELEEGARFCDHCGTPVGQFTMHQPQERGPANNFAAPGSYAAPANAAGPTPAPAPASMPVQAPATPPRPAKGKGRIVAIVLVVVAIAAIIVAGFVIFNQTQGNSAGSQGSGAAAVEQTKHTVVARIQAKGYDSEKGTPIPVQIAGEDADGNAVDELQFVASDGTGIELPSGSYEISFPASPINGDGTLYTMPDKPVALEIAEDGTASEEPTVKMTPIDAIDVTDELIGTAKEYAKKSSLDEASVTAAVEKAAQVRNDAVAKAEAEKKRQEEEERKAREAIPAGDYSYVASAGGLRASITINGDGTAVMNSAYAMRPETSQTGFRLDKTDKKAPNGNVIYDMVPIAGSGATTMTVYYDSAQNALIVDGNMAFVRV